jgi:hypothetical protein
MMNLRVFDVEHGACAMFSGPANGLGMIDCGHNGSTGWRPGDFISQRLGRRSVNYFLSTNVDQDHISDLATLTRAGITIERMVSNTNVPDQVLREIKRRAGPLTADAEAFLDMRVSFGPPGNVTGPWFSEMMGGINFETFGHPYPTFQDTNNLSQTYFIKYGPFEILFPGDLERDGWRAHLRNPAFVAALRRTTILVASHHGRENGFCEEAFEFLQPQAVVVSDKSIVHATQEFVPDYRCVVRPQQGIVVDGCATRRHVLTTRRDGDILFSVEPNGNYRVKLGSTGLT